jgi:hypothetical protein
LLPDDVRAEIPLLTGSISFLAEPLGQVEHDRDRQAVVFPGQGDERLARLGLDVGRVDDRQAAQGETLSGDEVQEFEGVVRDRLIVLSVTDHRTAEVGGEDFGRKEMLPRERTLAGTAGADKYDER